jgi:dolichyl-phosphate beta-glucosyltransferase
MSGEAQPVKTIMALSVVIPAYNEEKRITRTLHAAANYLHKRRTPSEIVVVSDGSRDNTGGVVSDFIAEWEQANPQSPVRVCLLAYEPNRGKGHAVRYGVLRTEGMRVLFMDADLATPIEELPLLESALQKGEGVAIGSRPLRQSTLLVRQPWYREGAGRIFNKMVQLAATPGIADTQCGFKLFTREAAHEIFRRCVLDGFSFDVEALFLARRLGYTIAEVPVRWAHQEGAAAFPNVRAYLRHGLHMVADLVRIRRTHRALRPLNVTTTTTAPPRFPAA